MTRPKSPGSRPRSGITLTEILISIFSMGIGMLSLATLFPLGVQRLRDAARSSRSAMLVESATSEIASRDLLYPPSFSVNGYPFDPFTQDPGGGAGVLDRTAVGYGAGLPICYDPMWWYQVNKDSNGAIQPSLTEGSDFRFGSGIGSIRDDASNPPTFSSVPTSTISPSAHGLQRITNFPLIFFPTPQAPATSNVPIDPWSLFASPDDIVMQSDGERYKILQPNGLVVDGNGGASPLVPDLSNADRMNDYAYTWMFTGKQTDVTNGTIFDGDLVIFHNRPFSVEVRGGVRGAAGERVVEAIWGYNSKHGGNGYGLSNRSVLLRWPNTQPDPDVRTGGWIADVTYERSGSTEVSRFYQELVPGNPATRGVYPAQRCHWYRVIKRTEPTTDHELSGFRETLVTLGSDLRAKTPLIGINGSARHVNAALVSPYVVNVVPRVFYSK